MYMYNIMYMCVCICAVCGPVYMDQHVQDPEMAKQTELRGHNFLTCQIVGHFLWHID